MCSLLWRAELKAENLRYSSFSLELLLELSLDVFTKVGNFEFLASDFSAEKNFSQLLYCITGLWKKFYHF